MSALWSDIWAKSKSQICQILLKLHKFSQNLRVQLKWPQPVHTLQINQAVQKILTEPLNAKDDLIAKNHIERGGYLDQSLNFKEHAKQKTKKTVSNLVKIRLIRRYLSTESCTTLVMMLCITYLDCGNVLLYDIPRKTIGKYQLIQSICIKPVLNQSKHASSTESLKTPTSYLYNKQLSKRYNNIQMYQRYNTSIPSRSNTTQGK